MDHQTSEARCVSYDVSIPIHTSVAKVWKALTSQINRWWLPSYQMLGTDSVVQLELKAGGRLFEQADGRELLWYTVVYIEPESLITLVGSISPQFGGPATTMLTIRLSSTEAGTLVCVNDALFGCVSDGLVRSLHSGWTELFTEGLRTFAEKEDL